MDALAGGGEGKQRERERSSSDYSPFITEPHKDQNKGWHPGSQIHSVTSACFTVRPPRPLHCTLVFARCSQMGPPGKELDLWKCTPASLTKGRRDRQKKERSGTLPARGEVPPLRSGRNQGQGQSSSTRYSVQANHKFAAVAVTTLSIETPFAAILLDDPVSCG